ncbi:MAG: aldo/keto reductase [Aliarcobacter sp.]|nr:aldo/keto reductase [Aliarcobacter sp.]
MKIPNMIYGTAWKKENTTNLVYEALMQGFKGIDTACQPKHYREDLVGQGLLKAYEFGIKREDLFLQTKFTPIDGQDQTNMPYLQNDDIETQIEKSFETSKKNLQTNFINSYILHSPVYPASKLLRVWQKMQEFVEKKEVGQIGISNCYEIETLKFLYENAKTKPSIVQNRFYSQSKYDREIREFCNQKNITYQSFWSLSANPHILNNQLLQNLAKKYEREAEQIFYRFLNQIQIIPLNGTTSSKHMKDDLKIHEFELTNIEIQQINALLV